MGMRLDSTPEIRPTAADVTNLRILRLGAVVLRRHTRQLYKALASAKRAVLVLKEQVEVLAMIQVVESWSGDVNGLVRKRAK
jgi:hypothetical protein